MTARVPAPVPRSVIGDLVAALAPERRRAALAMTLASLASLAAVGLAASSAWLIDRAAERPGLTALTAAMCLVQFLAFAKAGLRYGERLGIHDLAFRLLGRLRVRVFASLGRLAPAGLRTARTGDLLARCIDDVDTLQNLYLVALPQAVSAAVTTIASVAAVSILAPRAGLVLLAGLVANALVVPVVAHRLAAPASQAVAGLEGELAAEVADLLAVAPELAASGTSGRRLDRIQALDAALCRAELAAARRRGVHVALGLAVGGATVIGLVLAGVAALRAGSMPRVDLAVLPIVGLAALELTSGLGDAFANVPADLAAGERLLSLERLPDPVAEPTGREHAAPSRVPVPVGYESVTVAYPGSDVPALSGLSASVAAGGRLGITGPSGSGKSTAAMALLRLVDCEDGRIALGGRDVASERSAVVRREVGALGADDHVFSGSVRQNLLLARPAATDGELWEALEAVHLAETVRGWPEGLSAAVGEDGSRLSGGERRRLCLARVLLRDSAVVVLDEPTANLDVATGAEVLSDTLAMLGDRTVLVISHRQSDLDEMDSVVRVG